MSYAQLTPVFLRHSYPRSAAFVALSFGVHIAALATVSHWPTGAPRVPPLDAVEVAIVEAEAEPKPEPGPPPAPETIPQREAVQPPVRTAARPKTQARKAQRRQEPIGEPDAPEPATEPQAPLNFDKLVLSNSTAGGLAVNASTSGTGTGRARSGTMREGVVPRANTGPVGPATVALGRLSRRPEAPELGAALERNFPPLAKRQGVAGTARVAVRISELGRARVTRVLMESPQDYGFGKACKATVDGSKWSAPRGPDGKAVATRINYRCTFRVTR